MNYTRRLSSTAALMALAAMSGAGGAVAGEAPEPQRATPTELKFTPSYKVPAMREEPGTLHYHSSGRGHPWSQPKRRRLFRGISRTVSGRRK